MTIFDTNHNKSKCTYKKFRFFFFHSKRESKNITEDSQTHGPTYVCVCMYVCMDACMHHPLKNHCQAHSSIQQIATHPSTFIWCSTEPVIFYLRTELENEHFVLLIGFSYCLKLYIEWSSLKKKEKKKVNAIRD